jgi:predicted ATP-dependent serine protease
MSLDERKFEGDFDLSNFRNVDQLLEAVEKHKYQLVVVDSLQNLYSEVDHLGNEMKAAPGSNKQTEICAEKITAYAKRTLTTFILICHSTKGGDFKGSQSLEHVIDATIKISVEEDDEEGILRTLCLEKNRFGMTNINYNLEMTSHGLSLSTRVEIEEVEVETKKVPVKRVARQMFANMLGCTKKQFAEALIEATECRYETATMYFYHLSRNRVEV